ncbi:TDP-N-acetylfucosamine:lipid II N-acetylfucosaminyltransferase [Membranicola marinus]|uniref:TDP-N-acetylfucosamine:lipid II N-acetylfucosaminyltransferase n=1 Tax=Membranihabitans marinus TaxID=1227546 RepID=A0A953L5Q8_9BACT|nr:TDP-N-acetylfucosamine:lipid II N-acetylfucosaminyltransferase [Membranihabitans marinus]MBY5956847.1 TDP-N-acetylfucosamine:lipid II N-acetylfucosaminyltransferase [Membranihabitans marinus]
MYLHIIDESKTINHFIRRLREMDLHDHYFLTLQSAPSTDLHLPLTDRTEFFPSDNNIRLLTQSLHRYKAVFIHNLCYHKAKIVLASPRNVVFVWGIWGYDYYYVYPGLYRNIFLPATSLANIVLGKLSLTTKYLKYQLHPYLKHLGWNARERLQQQAAHRIDLTCNMMPNHSDVFRVVPKDPARRFPFSYYSIDFITEELSGSSYDLGPHIYVGNSASNSSNHLDVFRQLRGWTGDRDIVVPLGYGCPRYRRLINVAGRYFFKNHFTPINKYIPLKEYNENLLSCNVMIFNHIRAQGLGNIVFGIWAGHRVFLRASNPAYAFFKSMGVKVYALDSNTLTSSLNPLNLEEKIHNRKTIEHLYSEEQVQAHFKSLLKQIDQISSIAEQSHPHSVLHSSSN